MEKVIESYISLHSNFTTEDFSGMLRDADPTIGRSTIYKILKTLCEEHLITRTGRGHFVSKSRSEYTHTLSDTSQAIVSAIISEYPLVDFQIWELYQMNEFVNHLLAHNTIFIEVEDMLDESIFNFLFEKYPHVLHKPTTDEYYKYSGDETIIVRKLISEAPPSYGVLKQASLEKILVDLFGRGISGSVISKSEYPAIYEDSFKKYNINQAKMFRYARRRGIDNTIRKFIREKTYIELEAGK